MLRLPKLENKEQVIFYLLINLSIKVPTKQAIKIKI